MLEMHCICIALSGLQATLSGQTQPIVAPVVPMNQCLLCLYETLIITIITLLSLLKRANEVSAKYCKILASKFMKMS
jgi:hypothetical protein